MNIAGTGHADAIADVIMHYKTEDYVKAIVFFATDYVSELAYAALN